MSRKPMLLVGLCNIYRINITNYTVLGFFFPFYFCFCFRQAVMGQKLHYKNFHQKHRITFLLELYVGDVYSHINVILDKFIA